MSDLTENEIFSCLKTNLRSAATDCDIIAKQPVSGVHFDRMRKSLKLVEGACRQAAMWREDARWLQPGLYAEEAHQRARLWLHRPSVSSKKLFTKLGEALRKMLADIEKMEKAATGRSGLILPASMTMRAPLRENTPISVPDLTGIARIH